MNRSWRYALLSLRDMAVSMGPLLLVTLGLLGLAYWWLQPTPPRHVVLATGPEQSAYERFGQAYAQALAPYGIEVRLRTTGGAADNLALLRAGEVDLGFVRGGSGQLDNSLDLQSLGNLFVEPLWLFYRADAAQRLNGQRTVDRLADLRGWRVHVGTDGSGVPALFQQLLAANGIPAQQLHLDKQEQTPATVAFLQGQLDAVVFASAPEAVMVQMLLQTPGVRLMPFEQGQAYSRRFDFLTPVVLPQGVVDLAHNRPPRNTPLIASTTSLLALADTHPAVVQLMAQTARQLHSPTGWFNRAREYPNLAHAEVPVGKEAERALMNGPPWLQRYLPFWLANLIERMWLSLGLILALALPLSRVVPPLYTLRVRSRVYRWYAELRGIEEEATQGTLDRAGLLERLDKLDRHAESIQVPLSYTDELYALRDHINQVRQRLERQPHTTKATP